MNKKILAGALASVMAVACAANVSALETETDGTGWWEGHTSGVEVTLDGIEVTFTATAHEDATDNWHGPLYVVYTGDEAVVNGAGYKEYFVARADVYGWDAASGTNTADGLGAGWSWSVDGDTDWDNWVANMKAGVNCSLKATLGNNGVTVVFSANGMTSTAVIPVDSDTIYISLFGEKCKLTNIKLVDNTPAPAPDPAPGDGNGETAGPGADPNKGTPDTGVEGVAVAAGLAIIAAGAVVVAKKRS